MKVWYDPISNLIMLVQNGFLLAIPNPVGPAWFPLARSPKKRGWVYIGEFDENAG